MSRPLSTEAHKFDHISYHRAAQVPTAGYSIISCTFALLLPKELLICQNKVRCYMVSGTPTL